MTKALPGLPDGFPDFSLTRGLGYKTPDDVGPAEVVEVLPVLVELHHDLGDVVFDFLLGRPLLDLEVAPAEDEDVDSRQQQNSGQDDQDVLAHCC